jgi:hypothetical protein
MRANLYESEQINLRVFDLTDDSHFIRVEVLTKILQGIQKIVTILAEDELKLPYVGNASSKTKKPLSVYCGIPDRGSYVIPIEFGCTDEQSTWYGYGLTEGVAKKIERIFYSLGKDSADDIGKLVIDPTSRKRLFKNLCTILPPTDGKWQLEISGKRYKQKLCFNSNSRQRLIQLQEELCMSKDTCLQTLQTVTGSLVRMDFERRCVTLKYPPTKTELKCYYTEDIESELFENRGDLLQITGNVTYEDDNETPKKIADVQKIEFLDTSEFVLDTVHYRQTNLKFKQPLTLTPKLTESCQFMEIQNTDLGIDIIAQTRDELWDELMAVIEVQWEECAKQPDSKLGSEFCRQKRNLLAAIEEVK